MDIVIHKINTIKELKYIPKKYGVEIDVRAYKKKIVLSHEPFISGENLNNYLNFFFHKLLVINIKETGIEKKVLNILKKKNIKNFFLLDLEFPFYFRAKKKDLTNTSIRFSQFESINTVQNYKNKVKWVWIDTYKKFPIIKSDIKILNYFKNCLVCPERWGRPGDINKYISKIKKNNYKIDAVMTSIKYASQWEKAFD
jgi:hypothetical protein